VLYITPERSETSLNVQPFSAASSLTLILTKPMLDNGCYNTLE